MCHKAETKTDPPFVLSTLHYQFLKTQEPRRCKIQAHRVFFVLKICGENYAAHRLLFFSSPCHVSSIENMETDF